MLEELSWKQFLEWRVYRELNPDSDTRASYHSAQIVEALYHIATKGNNRWRVEDFLLHFGDDPLNRPAPEMKQSVEYQERMIDSWIYVSNALLSKKKAS